MVVELRRPAETPSAGDTDALAALARVQARLLARVPHIGAGQANGQSADRCLEVDSRALSELAMSPDVVSVRVDQVRRPSAERNRAAHRCADGVESRRDGRRLGRGHRRQRRRQIASVPCWESRLRSLLFDGRGHGLVGVPGRQPTRPQSVPAFPVRQVSTAAITAPTWLASPQEPVPPSREWQRPPRSSPSRCIRASMTSRSAHRTRHRVSARSTPTSWQDWIACSHCALNTISPPRA